MAETTTYEPVGDRSSSRACYSNDMRNDLPDSYTALGTMEVSGVVFACVRLSIRLSGSKIASALELLGTSSFRVFPCVSRRRLKNYSSTASSMQRFSLIQMNERDFTSTNIGGFSVGYSSSCANATELIAVICSNQLETVCPSFAPPVRLVRLHFTPARLYKPFCTWSFLI
ncbi:hypothetical protein ANCCAN_05729 [Ancylostoma caninum]|uniref:Uncharacterized protein n=1 Tax=Ancylostoma caninum TaxID=29170 RepID=A0A368GV39_ANCCA|nr:hypothetical protein ANCCAN_05729 [Ancylostoma caninum]